MEERIKTFFEFTPIKIISIILFPFVLLIGVFIGGDKYDDNTNDYQ